MGRSRVWAGRGTAVALTLAATATTARAHAVAGSRFDAPLPLSLLLLGSGATVGVTALWLALTDRAPASGSGELEVLTLPPRGTGVFVAVVRSGFVAVVGITVVAGLSGPQIAAENVATVFVWPVWFRGIALLAVLLGSPWELLSPWRSFHALLERLEGRSLAVLGTYPTRLGAWPALVGFLFLVGVIENLTVVPLSPRLTAVVVAGYGGATVVGAVLFGPAWLRRADPLGVLYRLLGRVAPLAVNRRTDGGATVSIRAPWRGCLTPVAGLSLVGFTVAAVYTVSFDGFVSTPEYQALLFGGRASLGTGAATSVAIYLGGFAAFVATFLAATSLVERLGGGSTADWRGAVRAFAPTVLPIAAAYEVAHNYPYVLTNLGRLVAVIARPILGHVDPLDPIWWLSLPLFWGSQVALVVAGHLVAVVAAHAVARRRYGSAAAALRGHLPLVALMVGYTVLSLWIVSRPVVAG